MASPSTSAAATMVAAVDVQYDAFGVGATAGLVVCDDVTCSRIAAEHTTRVSPVAPCEPGALFKRELPCIAAVLALAGPLDLLVVDGYATLDADGQPGLGVHAADLFHLPVIGVAKTPYRTATHAARVLRGTATRPLFVTVAGGIELAEAARIVANMAGPYRLPTALARADRLARTAPPPSPSP
jgi:deoxyribonuclease V